MVHDNQVSPELIADLHVHHILVSPIHDNFSLRIIHLIIIRLIIIRLIIIHLDTIRAL